MEGGRSLSSKIDRSLRERNRRMRMKGLCSYLFSVIPPQPSKLSIPDMMDQATTYIKQLQERIEESKLMKVLLEENCVRDDITSGNRLTELHIRTLESTLDINLICGLRTNFMLQQVVSILQEEGAEVISITYHNVVDRVFYTIYSQAICSRIGIETSRVHERLQKLI